MKTTDPNSDNRVKFFAEICWLGPIIGVSALRDGMPKVRIAGAENPALGKCFGAALVPVKTEGLKFRGDVAQSTEIKSDQYGWFHVDARASLWDGVEGVLVILLYNQSSKLEYYTYEDYKPEPADKARSAAIALSRAHSFAQILKPMPDELKSQIEGAIAEAVKELLKRSAEDLRDGLVKLPPPERAKFECGTDAGTMVATPPKESELVIAVASCQYPTAMLEGVIGGAAYERLAARLSADKPHPPQCLVLCGDQIYVDGTAGFFDPTSQFDRFVRPYEILFRMKAVREVRRQLPAFAMMDDHEIQDNWEPRIDDTRIDPVMVSGRRSYLTFQRRAGPDQQPPVDDSRCPLWYPFQVNGFPLFMADTRTERTPRIARTGKTKRSIVTKDTDHRVREIENARIMSMGQMKYLLDWLRRQPPDTPKIIASPAILLPRHARAVTPGEAISVRALHSDGWDGYPRSLYEILAHIAREQIPNVVFVSGDEHLSCVARIVLKAPDRDPVVVHSVHCSPLFAPFPFANSLRADLMADEEFHFPTSEDRGRVTSNVETEFAPLGDEKLSDDQKRVVTCSVETKFAPPGDGFTLLRFFYNRGGWMMHCEFDRAHVKDDAAKVIERKLA